MKLKKRVFDFLGYLMKKGVFEIIILLAVEKKYKN